MAGILEANLIHGYKLIHKFGLSDLISSHLSCRSPQNPEIFLTARFGTLADKIGPMDVRRMHINVDWSGEMDVSPSAVRLHSEIYRRRPDVFAIAHTHAQDGVAFAATDMKLEPVSQFSLPFIGHVGYANYEGPLISMERCARIVDVLAGHCAVILRNHGLLTVGGEMSESFYLMYYLNLACRAQLMARSSGSPLLKIDSDFLETAIRDTRQGPYPMGKMEWEVLTSDL